MTKLRSILYNNRRVDWHGVTSFLVQVSSSDAGYTTRHCVCGDLGLAIRLYEKIKLRAGDKKRLLMPNGTVCPVLAHTSHGKGK